MTWQQEEKQIKGNYMFCNSRPEFIAAAEVWEAVLMMVLYPACAQLEASSRIWETTCTTVRCSLLKVRALRSNQIVQDISTTVESKAFLLLLWTVFLALAHQSAKVVSWVEGVNEATPSANSKW